MKYMDLKTHDDCMKISKIVIGTDYFGTSVSKNTAFKLLDIFVEAGGNCVDTARVYAEWIPGGKGASEKLIGEWLKSRGNRNKVVISTKGGHPPIGNMEFGRLSRECIEADLDDSLMELGVDYIDLYWLHRDDLSRPIEDIMDSLDKIVKEGKVRAVGCSNWTVERIEQANAYATAKGTVSLCTSQIQWSLASSTPEAHQDPTIVCMDDKMYDWYLLHSFPVMAYSAQAKGFFSRAAVSGLDSINQKALNRFCTPENIERLERVKEYAFKNNLNPTAVALGYITCNKLPAIAIVGCKTEEQLKDTLTATDINITEVVAEWLYMGNKSASK